MLQALAAAHEGVPRPSGLAAHAGRRPAVFSGIPDLKLQQFALEAQALNAAVLNELAGDKRLILIACFIRRQISRSLDDAAEMFIRQMQRMHNRAAERLSATRPSRWNGPIP